MRAHVLSHAIRWRPLAPALLRMHEQGIGRPAVRRRLLFVPCEHLDRRGETIAWSPDFDACHDAELAHEFRRLADRLSRAAG